MGLATSTMPATDFCHWREDVTIARGVGGRGEGWGGDQRHVKINIDNAVILLIKNYRSVSDVSSEQGLEFRRRGLLVNE